VNAELCIPVALVVDFLLGDPQSLPHPTRAIGSFATKVEALLRDGNAGSRKNIAAGCLGWMLVVGISTAAAYCVIEIGAHVIGVIAAEFGGKPSWWAEIWHAAASVYLVYASIAPRDLATHAFRVHRALHDKQVGTSQSMLAAGAVERLAAGRREVSRLVGRDVERLDEEGVIRAAVESVAESTVDGVCAPLLWAFLLGPAAAIAYRAINTLDSMWGHRDERYLYFGRVAAKADDLFTWPAARLAFIASIGATALTWTFVPSRFNVKNALYIGLRDKRQHASPNSAWLEASFSGALGIKLAGPAWYNGVLCDKPTIGDAKRPVEIADITRATLLMYLTSMIFTASGLAANSILVRLATMLF